MTIRPEGPPSPIVALHGAYGAPEDWQAVWEALPSTITFDERQTPWLPGHQTPDDACDDLPPWRRAGSRRSPRSRRRSRTCSGSP